MLLYLTQKKCAPSSADRVPGYEPVGREFESPGARQKKPKSNIVRFRFLFIQAEGLVYHHTKCAYHQRSCISSRSACIDFGLMIYKTFALVIYKTAF